MLLVALDRDEQHPGRLRILGSLDGPVGHPARHIDDIPSDVGQTLRQFLIECIDTPETWPPFCCDEHDVQSILQIGRSEFAKAAQLCDTLLLSHRVLTIDRQEVLLLLYRDLCGPVAFGILRATTQRLDWGT